MILAFSLTEFFVNIIMAIIILLLIITPILAFIVGMRLILKDGKERRRLEKQSKQNPNITITFRRDA